MPCPYDPITDTTGHAGMYHCPDCNQMVVAGVPHPDWERLSALFEQDEPREEDAP